jgi:hypothetical protein
VQGLGQGGPEIPVVPGAPHVRARVPLDGVVQVGELERVAQEEDGRIVADQVPVPFLRVELDGEAPEVALGIGSQGLEAWIPALGAGPFLAMSPTNFNSER